MYKRKKRSLNKFFLNLIPLVLFAVLFFCSLSAAAQHQPASANSTLLLPLRYEQLALGDIEPRGWVKDQLERMKNGLTGHLDEYYPQVVGKRNAWLGGDGDAWERGPYWIDGLLPLAYLLKDKGLMQKVKPWIEWTINNQRSDGYIGPRPLDKKMSVETGIQKEPREDWWPRMVMLKVLQQYYNATGDKRILITLSNYFRYQWQQLPQHPLDQWSFWGNQRGADNLNIVYWLYRITKEDFLLELGDLLYQQTYPFATVFLNKRSLPPSGFRHLYPFDIGNVYPFDKTIIAQKQVGLVQSFHCVNLAQGIKTPVVYFQRTGDSLLLKSVKKAFEDIDLFHGQAQGMFGGDEAMHGNAPTQGIEFCSVSEMMFSLETMLSVTGQEWLADRLEKIVYNALPAQATDDFMYRQYFQTANQVLVSRANRNFFEDQQHDGTDACFGLLTGYPCCTTNMHQAWPKWVQNLWYRTGADSGIAAMLFAPSAVSFKLNGGNAISIEESTTYPFGEKVHFKIQARQPATFPFYLRIPQWCSRASVWVNGKQQPVSCTPGSTIKLTRGWASGDEVALHLPMEITTSRWAESSVAIERGPLVFALKIEEEWKRREDKDRFGVYYEVSPKTDWNYGLLREDCESPNTRFTLIAKTPSGYPWTPDRAPLIIKARAKQIPSWQLYNNTAGPLPHSAVHTEPGEKEITLLPYGCTTLRITQFPALD